MLSKLLAEVRVLRIIPSFTELTLLPVFYFSTFSRLNVSTFMGVRERVGVRSGKSIMITTLDKIYSTITDNIHNAVFLC